MKRIIPLGLFLLGACMEEAPSEAPAFYHRTVLVYMGGDNNLSSETDAKIHALASGWDRSDCRLIIYQDKGGAPCLYEVTREGIERVKTIQTRIQHPVLLFGVRLLTCFPVILQRATAWLFSAMVPGGFPKACIPTPAALSQTGTMRWR